MRFASQKGSHFRCTVAARHTCVFRPICIHWSWRRRCILPSILGITLITRLAWRWRVRPGGSGRIAGVWAGSTARLLGIGWVRGGWAWAGVRWRIFVVHVGCRICPAEGKQTEELVCFCLLHPQPRDSHFRLLLGGPCIKHEK